MRVFTSAAEMLNWSNGHRAEGKSIGFVPTMGALHNGHGSLVQMASEQNDLVVVSVFVNPTQFNQATDLEKYPRTFEADKRFLENLGVHVMFHPPESEVYPADEPLETFELDGLDALMEGPNRPGHFNGVVQVVSRLFRLVQPTRAYFGEKDFQQLAIIRYMTRKLGLPVEVIGRPTVREADGLAMSSRNIRLTDSGRQNATVIYETLLQLKQDVQTKSFDQAIRAAEQRIGSVEGVQCEYVELVDPHTLQRATPDSEAVQACIAAWVDEVRLIDNMRVK